MTKAIKRRNLVGALLRWHGMVSIVQTTLGRIEMETDDEEIKERCNRSFQECADLSLSIFKKAEAA